MSFILDALKKSEAERQRQTGPTLLELRITRPRRRYPAWALLIGVLLAINVVVLAVVLMHRPMPAGGTATASAAASTPAAPATAAALTAAARVPAAAGSGPRPAAAAGYPAAAVALPSPLAPPHAPVSPGRAVPLTNDTGDANPADHAPAAVGTMGATASAGTGAASLAQYEALPSLDELGGDIPRLHLDLLSYSELPGERYALINMHRVHEGDTTPEGARVLAITPYGVALDYRGQQFLLRSSASTP